MITVLILGAGVSRAMGEKYPRAKKPPLDSDFFEIAKAVDKEGCEEIKKNLQDLVGDYAYILLESLEASADCLYLKSVDSNRNSAGHLGFLNLLQLLTKVLAKTTNGISLGWKSLLYRFILSEIKKVKCELEDLSIITFNYDLLIERTLDKIAGTQGREHLFSFPECYRLSNIKDIGKIKGNEPFSNINKNYMGIPILKLHGSMNWQSRHKSKNPLPGEFFSSGRQIRVMNSSKIPISIESSSGKRKMLMKPIIVPPVGGKRNVMHNSMADIWKLAAEKLQSANRIVVAGYSCPPLDMESHILLSENLRDNKKKSYISLTQMLNQRQNS